MKIPEMIFQDIIAQLPHGEEGQMFGAKYIKGANSKAAAFLWKGHMTFKLSKDDQDKALKLKEAYVASHLYATEKLMTG
jgi:hypothetical protein